MNNELLQLIEQVEARGIDVNAKSVGGGQRTGTALTIVPNQLCTFAVYNSDSLANDKAQWSAKSEQGGFQTNAITLIDAELNERVEGGAANATNPDARKYLQLLASVVFGDTTTLGTVGPNDEFVVHPFWDKVAGVTKRVELSISAIPESAQQLHDVLVASGFVPSAGTRLAAGGQSRKWALQAPNSGGDRSAFGEKIANGLSLTSMRIGANASANTREEFTARDVLTNFERTMARWLKAMASGDESKCRHMGVLSGTTWGPHFYASNAPRQCYSGRMGLFEVGFKNWAGSDASISFVNTSGFNQES